MLFVEFGDLGSSGNETFAIVFYPADFINVFSVERENFLELISKSGITFGRNCYESFQSSIDQAKDLRCHVVAL